MSNRHLLTVWNPSYSADALDAHVQCLLDQLRPMRSSSSSQADPEAMLDDVCVWWGRVRSANRNHGALPHHGEILALSEQIDAQEEMQLYLTDYQSLYVAHLRDIVDGDFVPPAHQVPAYYQRDGLHCDMWFQLDDIRALVANDTIEVQQELRHLRVIAYYDRPVSLYGGIVDLPLIVRRDDDATFFSHGEYDAYTDGRLWVEADAERGGLGGLLADLRDNVLGDTVWSRLFPKTRLFVGTAERLMREYRRDPTFDYAVVLVELSKAIEVQVNALLRPVLKAAPAAIRSWNDNGVSQDYSLRETHTMGQLVRILTQDKARADYLVRMFRHGRWLVDQLAPVMDELARYRNDAAHSDRCRREDVLPLRNQIMGVGCEGILAQLSKVSPV
jgi:hypothetical protein